MTSDVNHMGIHWKASDAWNWVGTCIHSVRNALNQFEYICAAAGGADWTLGCISIEHIVGLKTYSNSTLFN